MLRSEFADQHFLVTKQTAKAHTRTPYNINRTKKDVNHK